MPAFNNGTMRLHQDIHEMAYRSVVVLFGVVWSSMEHGTAPNSHTIRIIRIRTSGLYVSDFISGHVYLITALHSLQEKAQR